jgi:hypothetical protein
MAVFLSKLEEFYLLGYNALKSIESQLHFERIVASNFSFEEMTKEETSVNQVASTTCCSPKCGLISNGLHSAVSEKRALHNQCRGNLKPC